LRDLYDEIATYLMALGDDVQEKHLKYYIAFKRFQNFVEVYSKVVDGKKERAYPLI